MAIETLQGEFMSETVQEYIQRILSNSAGKDPMKVQGATAAKLKRLIQGVPASKLSKRPAPGKWSAAEIIAHLADGEIATSWRIRQILSAPGIPLQAYDQDAWNVSGKYEKRNARKSLEMFRVLREANLWLLKSLTPAQRKQHGMHAERGVETVEHITQMIAGHDLNHLAQVERVLARKKS
jgi:hypothetical protein